MRNRSLLVQLSVCLLLVLALSIQAMAAPITLRLMTVWGAEQKEHLDALLAEYSQINPDVEIVHEVMAGAGAALYQEVLQTGFAGGSGPDVYFEWAGELAGYFIDSGFAEPLERYYERYGWDEILIPWAVDALVRNGRVYGVPVSTHGMTFWYRADLMNQLGLEEPQTYAELEALCQKARGQGIYPLSLGGKYNWQVMRLLDFLIEHTCGPELHDKLNRLETSWDCPEVVAAYSLFKKWVDNDWITPGFLMVAPDDARIPWYQGMALMVFEGSWMETTLINDGQDPYNFGFFLNPTDHDPVRISGFAEQFMISSVTPYKEEAAEFLNWIISREVQQRGLGTAFGSTGTIGVAPDPQQLPNTYKWRQVLTTLDATYPPHDQVFQAELLHHFFEVQDGLVTGDFTPESGAKYFQKAVEEWKASQ